MSQLKLLLLEARRQIASPRFRYLPAVLAAGVAMGTLALLIWMPAERLRLERREVEIGKELTAIQNDLAEIERLKMRKPPPPVPGSAIQEALSVSLASVGSSLSIALVDSEHLRVQGSGKFDDVVRWLGDTQQSHRLTTTRMSAIRQQDAVVVDITLSSQRQ